MPNKTADTMTAKDLPEGTRPEEFLTDAGLAGFYERELESMKANDPRRAEVAAQAARAKLAALTTEAAQAQAEADG